MSENLDTELAGWFPTYGLITAQRILERYKIKLRDDDLLYVLKNPTSFYYQLLQLPLKNVYNGIIMQQVMDYQLFAQKLFIDYLLSGEDEKVESAPGSSTREQIEEQRKILIVMNEAFDGIELEHEKLIAQSQELLMKSAHTWQSTIKQIAKEQSLELQKHSLYQPDSVWQRVFTKLLVHFNANESQVLSDGHWLAAEKIIDSSIPAQARIIILEKLSTLSLFVLETVENLHEFRHKIGEMNTLLRQRRSEYRQFIVRVNELLQLLPQKLIDEQQVKENRAALMFNANLGEEQQE